MNKSSLDDKITFWGWGKQGLCKHKHLSLTPSTHVKSKRVCNLHDLDPGVGAGGVGAETRSLGLPGCQYPVAEMVSSRFRKRPSFREIQ